MGNGPRKVATAGVALLPLCAYPGMLFRESWEVTSVYGACVAFMLWLKSAWFRLFMLAALVALARNPVFASLSGMAMIVIFLGAANVLLDAPENHVLSAIRIAAAGMGTMILLQLAHAIPLFTGRPTGYFNPDAAGVFFALCFPAFLRGRWRLAAPLVAGFVLLSGTTTGFAALIAGFAVYAAIRHPGVWLYVFSGIVAVCAAWGCWIDPFVSTLNNDRWTVWKHVLLTFRSERFGRGIGSFRETFQNFISGDPGLSSYHWTNAHNEYLQAGYELGVQAVLLVGAFLAVFAVRTVRHRDRMTKTHMQAAAGVAAVAVSCAGWTTFHIAPLALISLAWISMWVAAREENGKHEIGKRAND